MALVDEMKAAQDFHACMRLVERVDGEVVGKDNWLRKAYKRLFLRKAVLYAINTDQCETVINIVPTLDLDTDGTKHSAAIMELAQLQRRNLLQ